MNGTMKYSLYLGVMLLTLCFCGCADETVVDSSKGDGALLNMYVSAEANTRLAELGDASNMFKPAGQKGYENIGLYIYYEDDYTDKDGHIPDLSKPYVRNLECVGEVNDGKFTGNLKPKSGEQIYIYDRMTIVAFYPYNAAMSNEKNYFKVKADEKAYPITESDYAQQLYIPYRTQTNVNPTNAYMTELHFYPQQTCKIEVVLVANNESLFPTNAESGYQTDGEIKIVPSIDRYDGPYNGEDDTKGEDKTKGDLRENWIDAIEKFPTDYDPTTEANGGNYVRRYTAYVWKSGKDDSHHDNHKHYNNKLVAGDILFESDKLTLKISNDLDLSEETVYRYGYNLNTGEIFIPTSDKLIYDAPSLQNTTFDEYHAYQVCDIDLSHFTNKNGQTWTSKETFRGTYDGGGHKISNLKIEATSTQEANTEADKQSFGLFGKITSESTLKNIELVNPHITVTCDDALKDTCYVGALCGIINPELSDAAKRKMILDGLPDELSTAVKEALVKERMANFAKTTCYVRGCKVTDPVIKVTGENVRVGGLCGGAGNQEQKAAIYDSYVSQTQTTYEGISVNAGSDEIKKKYTAAYVGGFCGMMSNGTPDGKTKGGITNCYSTLETIAAFVKKETKDAEGHVTETTSQEIAKGFYNPAPKGELINILVSGCYTKKDDTNTGVTNFTTGRPTWPLFSAGTVSNGGDKNYLTQGGSYPAFSWENSWGDMGTGNTYPTLIWENPLIQKLNQ